MWRWLHSLPRAVRQQFHGPGASAGVCVDDNEVKRECRWNQKKQFSENQKEKFQGNKKEQFCKNKWEQHDGRSECELRTFRGNKKEHFWGRKREHQDDRSRYRFRVFRLNKREQWNKREKFQRSKRQHFWWNQREQNKNKSHCNFRHNYNEEGNDHKGTRPGKHNFWDMVHGPFSTIEAIGWGGVIALGIQVGQFQCLHQKYKSPPEYNKKHCLLYQVANALPTVGVITTNAAIQKNILPITSNKKIQKKSQERGREQKYHCFLADVVDAFPTLQTFDSVHKERWARNSFLVAGQKQEKDAQKPKTKAESPKVETLEAAFANFENVCKLYTATGKGIMGSEAALKGNMKTATALWEESSKLGHAKSQFNLAVCYETGQGLKKNMAEAVKYYTLAAEDNHTQAMYNLALLYMEGTSCTPVDTCRAVTMMTCAADMGLIEAQRYLGVYFMEEDSEDVIKAIKYLTLASDQHDAEAQYFLAMCYQFGYGVEENMCKAAFLFNRAAESESPDAIHSLALFHLQGLGGLPQDKHCAKVLLQKAVDLGHENAREDLDKLLAETALQEESNPSSDVHATERSEEVSFLMRLNSSVSSPCLTEHVRGNISHCDNQILYDPVSGSGTLSQIYTQLMLPRSITVAPSLTRWMEKMQTTSGSESSSDSGVVFELGHEDGEDVDLLYNDSLADTMLCEESTCSGLQRRTATMPELHMVPCI